MASHPIPRAALNPVTRALRRSPVVAVVGPRQCGKTTLARQLVPAGSANYFDLEDPVSLARLDQALTELRDMTGTVVIDEVQHRPDLFPLLRVLADRDANPARFLVLGSAGPDLLRQSAESLAGRIEYIELTGFQVAEVGAAEMGRLWVRGGFPRSFLSPPAPPDRHPAPTGRTATRSPPAGTGRRTRRCAPASAGRSPSSLPASPRRRITAPGTARAGRSL